MTCHLRLFDFQDGGRERERNDRIGAGRKSEREDWVGVERRGLDVTMYHRNGRCEIQILIAGQ